MHLKLEYLGKVEDQELFKYMVDGENCITRVKEYDKTHWILSIGFGNMRSKMVIEKQSRMGHDISTQIQNGEAG